MWPFKFLSVIAQLHNIYSVTACRFLYFSVLQGLTEVEEEVEEVDLGGVVEGDGLVGVVVRGEDLVGVVVEEDSGDVVEEEVEGLEVV